MKKTILVSIFILFLITSFACKIPTVSDPNPDIDIIDIPRQYRDIVVTYTRNPDKILNHDAPGLSVTFEYKFYDPNGLNNKKADWDKIENNFIVGYQTVDKQGDHVYRKVFKKVLAHTDDRFKEHQFDVFDWMLHTSTSYGQTAEGIFIEVVGGGFRIETRKNGYTLLFKLVSI